MDAYEGYAQGKGVKIASDDKLTARDIEEMQRMMHAYEADRPRKTDA